MKKNKPQLSIICAMAENYVIGKQNQLPWHLPADLRHFKELTLGKSIIMGRKTYESIGKALPHRRNIIVSRKPDLSVIGCEVVHSLNEAIEVTYSEPEIMIIGGGNIITQAMPIADKIYLTLIHHSFIGDTYFPHWQTDEWQVIEKNDHFPDEKNPYAYSFVTMTRVR